MQNKKAQVEDWLQAILGIIFIIFILLTMRYCESQSNKKLIDFTKEETKIMDTDNLLIDFLREKSSDNRYPSINSVADLINFYYITDDDILKDKIEQKAIAFFSETYLREGYWGLIISDMPNNEKLMKINSLPGEFIVSISIPAAKNNKGIDYVRLEVYLSKYDYMT